MGGTGAKPYRVIRDGLTTMMEEGVATHSGVLAWRIPVDRGAWRATVHGVSESD